MGSIAMGLRMAAFSHRCSAMKSRKDDLSHIGSSIVPSPSRLGMSLLGVVTSVGLVTSELRFTCDLARKNIPNSKLFERPNGMASKKMMNG